MSGIVRFGFAVVLLVLSSGLTAGEYFEVQYPPSTEPGELIYGVKYTLWIPEGVKQVRGVIVHQHGCGAGACKSGEFAAYDLQWQELARKWDCALLGPSIEQGENSNCRAWCDPRNGSARALLNGLRDLSQKSGHPEIERAPWCLWGHSGGAFWSTLMQTLYPERIAAIWLRSGTAFYAWDSGEIPLPNFTVEAMMVPMISNPGIKEDGDQKFGRIWSGSVEMFQQYRQRGALLGFAPDPLSGHDCRESRALAIRFFDTCLAARLPDPGSDPAALKPMPIENAWYARLLSDQAQSADRFEGDLRTGGWLPDPKFAEAWKEYVQTGNVADSTPSEAPTEVAAKRLPDGTVEVTWSARGDLESGLSGFVVLRNGAEVGTVNPEKESPLGINRWQALAFHDTPTLKQPAMKWIDQEPATGGDVEYQVISLNGAGLKSLPSASGFVTK